MKRLLIPALLFLAACGAPKSASLDVGGAKLRVTGPYAHENLAVYLIHSDARDDRDYVTLDEALKSRQVEVTEKAQEQVNELTLENKGDRPVFVQEGDRVIGGKQDRIIGLSFVVPPKSGKMPVPSFCVESGRWAGAQMFFSAGVTNAFASKEVREAAKFGKNQGEVWEQVARAKGEATRALQTPNTNSSLNETLESEKARKLCEAYAAAFAGLLPKHPDAVGAAIVLNGRIEEVNVYPGHPLLAKVFPRLVQSYALAAIAKKEGPAAPAAGDVARFMQEGQVRNRRSEKVAGGNDLDVMDCDKQLRCETRYGGQVVHAQWMNRGEASAPRGDERRNRGQNEQPQQQQEQQPPKRD